MQTANPAPSPHDTGLIPARGLRAPVLLALVAATAGLGLSMMFDILRIDGITPLEGLILALFGVTFGWISIAFWSAVIGFLLLVSRRDPLTLCRTGGQDPGRRQRPRGRVALIMPVHNEPAGRVAACLEATCAAVSRQPQAAPGQFEAFLLSDTTDPTIAAEEARTVALLQSRLADRMVVHYRRRADNRGRKAGNIADFCRQWGARYDFMVVLDADSVMTGDCIIRLVRAMNARPGTGIIQTAPSPAGQSTLFGRCLQFAAGLHGPVLAAGTSFWQADSANYWGHNAIIRVEAFREHCGLPRLPGGPPLGGEILSHDFVEAALMRRAGWGVELHTDLSGSFEEVPGNIMDYLARDRRWAQGNLQHLRLLLAPGLRPMSRLHFLLGATAYVSSLFWLLILLASTADAIARATAPERFFGSAYQLFPDWPVDKSEVIVSLMLVTVGLLLIPKLLALGHALLRRRKAFGGGTRLLTNALLEVFVSVLLAPIMMLFHSWFVLNVLAGRNVSWSAQNRGARALPWAEVLRRTAVAPLIGLVWGLLAWTYAPGFFPWLAPVLAGLLLSTWLVRLSASPSSPRSALFASPEEVSPPVALLESARTKPVGHKHQREHMTPNAPPEPVPRLMPVYEIDHWGPDVPASSPRRGWNRAAMSAISGLRAALRS